jgi:thioredoxin-related protein
MNKVPKPNSPRCTYCHQIKHQVNECPFIEDNVRQVFAKHFQNLNLKLAKVGNHGYIELKDLYHERVRILNQFK